MIQLRYEYGVITSITPSLAALLVALSLAAPASAAQFHVVDESPLVRHTSTGFSIAGKLRDPQSALKAGHERVRCFLSGPNQAECLGVVHLNGRVGGTGKLRFAGDIDADERRLRITGGKRDFEHVRGNVRVRGLSTERTRFRFYLTPAA